MPGARMTISCKRLQLASIPLRDIFTLASRWGGLLLTLGLIYCVKYSPGREA